MSYLYMYIHQFLVVDISKSSPLVDVLFFHEFIDICLTTNSAPTQCSHLWPMNISFSQPTKITGGHDPVLEFKNNGQS